MIVKYIRSNENVRRVFVDVDTVDVHGVLVALRKDVGFSNPTADYGTRFYNIGKTIAMINLAPGEYLEYIDEPAHS